MFFPFSNVQISTWFVLRFKLVLKLTRKQFQFLLLTNQCCRVLGISLKDHMISRNLFLQIILKIPKHDFVRVRAALHCLTTNCSILTKNLPPVYHISCVNPYSCPQWICETETNRGVKTSAHFEP